MNTPAIHPRDLIAGLQKGLALMQLFSAEQPRLSVPQAARLSGLTPSAVRRFLLTLVHEGFAETDSREYWLTPKALRIGQAYVDSAQLPRMLRPIVEQVARQTQEHVSVGTRDGDEIIHLVRSRYSHIASLSIRPGSRVPMYCTAGGRIWLAALEGATATDGGEQPQALPGDGLREGIIDDLRRRSEARARPDKGTSTRGAAKRAGRSGRGGAPSSRKGPR